MNVRYATKLRHFSLALAFSASTLMAATLPVASPAQAAGVTPNKPAIVQNTGGGSVRYREGAGLGYSVKGSLVAGDRVTVIEGPAKDAAGHSWYRVSVGGHIGWIDSRYLGATGATAAAATKAAAKAPAKAVAKAPAKLAGYAKVTNTGGDAIRLRATIGGKVVATASSGTVLSIAKGPVLDKSGARWYQVSGANLSGWMVADYLASTPAPARAVAKTTTKATTAKATTASAATARTGTARGAAPPAVARSVSGGVVSLAMNYVGYRYVFGGTTPSGFDCSGFVYYVFNKAGIAMGRSMNSELASGAHISSSQLQAGDLVYFAGTYRSGISHIGIYIGNGKMVHAGDYSTGVNVSDIWSPYWAAHYAGAVRVSR
jgi:cell wall-associated NlpC family hydrolase